MKTLSRWIFEIVVLSILIYFMVGLFTNIFAQDLLILEFSEAMDTTGLRTIENYELKFAPSAGQIVLSTYFYPVRIDSVGTTQFSNIVVLFTSRHPDTSGVFQVRVFNVFDLAGNPINLEANIAFY